MIRSYVYLFLPKRFCLLEHSRWKVIKDEDDLAKVKTLSLYHPTYFGNLQRKNKKKKRKKVE